MSQRQLNSFFQSTKRPLTSPSSSNQEPPVSEGSGVVIDLEATSNQRPSKRVALGPLSTNSAPKPLLSSDNTATKSLGAGFGGGTEEPKAPRVNVGGASKMLWFNVLATDPRLEAAKRNLVNKVASTKALVSGCIQVLGFSAETRPVMDKRFLEEFRKICPDAPARYMPYHISLLVRSSVQPVD